MKNKIILLADVVSYFLFVCFFGIVAHLATLATTSTAVNYVILLCFLAISGWGLLAIIDWE